MPPITTRVTIRVTDSARRFIATESASGIVLIAATVLALVAANSPWQHGYASIWHQRIAGDFDVHHLVNDGLMAMFFFVVALEIKREIRHGELSDRRVAALPVCAALGGMVVPAVVYLLVTRGSGSGHGWGIPMATDIAFALAVLGLLSSRVPPMLKVVLLTLAIVDDIGAIIVIALFYGGSLDKIALAVAVGGLLAIVALRLTRPGWTPAYLLLALVVWYATYRSGVHATIAGVAVAFVVPASERLEERIHPFTSFFVLPVFALANAGIVVSHDMLDGKGAGAVALGVAAGLVVGKVTGIVTGSWIAVRLGIATLPDGVSRRHIAGIGMLGGIGFTVSLFIAGLAFDDPALVDAAKLAILLASVVSAGAGALVLRVGARPGET